MSGGKVRSERVTLIRKAHLVKISGGGDHVGKNQAHTISSLRELFFARHRGGLFVFKSYAYETGHSNRGDATCVSHDDIRALISTRGQ